MSFRRTNYSSAANILCNLMQVSCGQSDLMVNMPFIFRLSNQLLIKVTLPVALSKKTNIHCLDSVKNNCCLNFFSNDAKLNNFMFKIKFIRMYIFLLFRIFKKFHWVILGSDVRAIKVKAIASVMVYSYFCKFWNINIVLEDVQR